MTQPRPAGPGGSELRRRRRVRTKTQIQDAALALFATKGYEGTSLDDIAHAAAVSPRTFYRYFPGKEDVVLWDEYDELQPQELWDAHLGQDPIELLVQRLREATATLYRADPDRLLLRAKLCCSVPEIRSRLVNRQLEMLGPYCRELVEACGFDLDDLRVVVPMGAVIMAMLVALEQWQRHDGAGDLLTLVDAAITALALPGHRRVPGGEASGPDAFGDLQRVVPQDQPGVDPDAGRGRPRGGVGAEGRRGRLHR